MDATVTAAAKAVLGPRLPLKKSSLGSSLPYFRPRRPSTQSITITIKHFSVEPHRFSSLLIKASSEETSSSGEVSELFTDLKEKWDALENKSTVLLYGSGAIVAVWLSSIVVGTLDSVPVLPKVMELVGLGYTAWFIYRYILFKSSRKELTTEIESFKKKITGSE